MAAFPIKILVASVVFNNWSEFLGLGNSLENAVPSEPSTYIFIVPKLLSLIVITRWFHTPTPGCWIEAWGLSLLYLKNNPDTFALRRFQLEV